MEYYLMLQGNVYGPYTLPQMKSLQLFADTPIHLSGWPTDKWVYASDLPELRECISDLNQAGTATNTIHVQTQQSYPNYNPIPVNTQNHVHVSSQPADGIKTRSIGLIIVFSIITLGIYFLYWFVVLTNETNRLAGEKYGTDGFVALLLDIITLGIYGLFWSYKLGEKTDIINNTPNSGSKALFLILSFIGFGWVGMFIAQDAVNKAVSRR